MPRFSQVAVIILQQTKKAAARQPSTTFRLIRQFGGVGLIPLAILDSSVIPTFGSLDLVTAWLAARDYTLWAYYAGMATLGSVIGAWITYRLGSRSGRGWIRRKIGEKRSDQICHALEHWGSGAVFVATLAPPPFPSSWFFFAAGTFHQSLKKFIWSVFVGRAIRYTIVTLLAAHYGRNFLRLARHPERYLLICLAITAALVLVTFIVYALRKPQLQSETVMRSS
jgi:membrane protein DedA with SNARE-associated domain